MYTIAILEDEELERQALCSTLSRHFNNVSILCEACNGEEAISMIDAFDIDLMLVDIRVPKVDGLEVIGHLRSKNQNTRVIVTTGYDYLDFMHRAIRFNVDEYLLKPIRPQMLIDTVAKCLNRLGAGTHSQETVKRLTGFLERTCYRDAVALVREHVEWIYAQDETAPHEQVMAFARQIVQLAEDRNLESCERLSLRAKRLQTIPPERRSKPQVLDVFLKMTDLLFDDGREEFGHAPERVHTALNYI